MPADSRRSAAASSRHDPGWLARVGMAHFVYQHKDPRKPFYYLNNANEAGGEAAGAPDLLQLCR